jgi:hypothetical protein
MRRLAMLLCALFLTATAAPADDASDGSAGDWGDWLTPYVNC